MALGSKSRLRVLLQRLRFVTLPRGKKSELAHFLGVPASRVSEWLSGVYEPGAEITLQLLEWVKAEEAKQNAPAVLRAPPRRKTRKGKSLREKPPSPPPK